MLDAVGLRRRFFSRSAILSRAGRVGRIELSGPSLQTRSRSARLSSPAGIPTDILLIEEVL
jgi:hypothetical protein